MATKVPHEMTSGVAAEDHEHEIADVTGLQTALDSKADTTSAAIDGTAGLFEAVFTEGTGTLNIVMTVPLYKK